VIVGRRNKNSSVSFAGFSAQPSGSTATLVSMGFLICKQYVFLLLASIVVAQITPYPGEIMLGMLVARRWLTRKYPITCFWWIPLCDLSCNDVIGWICGDDPSSLKTHKRKNLCTLWPPLGSSGTLGGYPTDKGNVFVVDMATQHGLVEFRNQMFWVNYQVRVRLMWPATELNESHSNGSPAGTTLISLACGHSILR
jgi:hypothetical protein